MIESGGDLIRCPFVRAIAEGREPDARALAAQPPDPAEPVVIEWLVGEARRRLQAQTEEATTVVDSDHLGTCCDCGEPCPIHMRRCQWCAALKYLA